MIARLFLFFVLFFRAHSVEDNSEKDSRKKVFFQNIIIWGIKIIFVSVTNGKFAGLRYVSGLGARRGVRCAQLDPVAPAEKKTIFPESDFTYTENCGAVKSDSNYTEKWNRLIFFRETDLIYTKNRAAVKSDCIYTKKFVSVTNRNDQ